MSTAILGPSTNTIKEELVTPLPKTVRKRNKAHLAFVAAQPCLGELSHSRRAAGEQHNAQIRIQQVEQRAHEIADRRRAKQAVRRFMMFDKLFGPSFVP